MNGGSNPPAPITGEDANVAPANSGDPDWTIWVMRPEDSEPWCWGGSYDDPSGSKAEKRVCELEAEHPASWGWGVRRGLGRDGVAS